MRRGNGHETKFTPDEIALCKSTRESLFARFVQVTKLIENETDTRRLSPLYKEYLKLESTISQFSKIEGINNG